MPEPKSNDDLKNTLKGDELFEVINPEGILTEIPDDFIENSEVDQNSELDQNSDFDRNSKIDENSEFDQNSESDTSDHLSILESDFEAPDEISQKSETDPNLGVTKIKWRITRTLKPKPPPPPPPRIESSNFESIQFDPSIYGGENFESENERQNLQVDNLNETQETVILESDKSEDYTVDVDDSILEEESVLYTKPYIKLRVDWMW